MYPTLAQIAAHPAFFAPVHAAAAGSLSPTQCAAGALAAFTIDWYAIGPDAAADRVAFCLYLAAFYGGLQGSGFGPWLAGILDSLFSALGGAAPHTPLVAGLVELAPVALGTWMLLCTLGALAPEAWDRFMGRLARRNFRPKGRCAGAPRTPGPGGGGSVGFWDRINRHLLVWALLDATLLPLQLSALPKTIFTTFLNVDAGLVGAATNLLLSVTHH